jgi:predicted negative regulator of RcsB-dependent stress response
MSNQNSLPESESRVDEVLNETEIGSIIAANKTIVIILVVLALGGVLGYGLYTVQSQKANDKNSSIMFNFTKDNFESFKNKKLAATEYVSKLETLSKEVSGFKGLSSLIISSSDELIAQSKTKEAIQVLNLGKDFKSPFVKYFINLRLVAAHEDLGNTDEAITILESMTKSSVKLLEGKLFLDLGRLYMAKNETAKAIENFEKVLSEGISQAEFVKLAKLYLSELKGK